MSYERTISKTFYTSAAVLICLIALASGAFANNISVSNVLVATRNTSAGVNNAANFTTVYLNVTWDNSWRSRSIGNWDAAWIFIKFRRGMSDPTLTNVSSAGTTVTVSSTAALRVGMPVTVTSGTGSFAAGTVISSITNSTSFVVSAAPATPLSGATISCARIWEHAWLNNSGHSVGSIGSGGALTLGLQTPGTSYNSATNPVLGVFMYRTDVGSGTFTSNNVQLRWNYGAQGIRDADSVDVRVFATEMVYVPAGSFFVGSGGTETGSFTNGSWTSGNTIPFQITSEAALGIDNAAGKLWGTSSTGANTIGNAPGDAEATLAAAFPKGFGAFYCMKYEISQGQYRDFLNTLTRTQQANRVTMDGVVARYAGGNILTNGTWSGNTVGSEVSNLTAPANRIGLRLVADPGGVSPRTYACDLNASASPYATVDQSDDGEWIAMGQLNWMDACAYLDWSGLRPMTELEFEKACRGPQATVPNEYAWGNATATAANNITNGGQVAEVTNTANANTNATRQTNVQGPMRVGTFAGTATTRAQAGASYYGIMEMSGNVWERLVNLGATSGRNYTGVHGDGLLSTSGHATTAFWPGLTSGEVTASTGSGARGSSWDTQASDDLRISDRNLAVNEIPPRYSATGSRGVRTDNIWTLRTSAADNTWQSVAFGNNIFVAVCRSGAGNNVMTSPDGVTWTLRTAIDQSWNDVVFGNGVFVAVASSIAAGFTNNVMTSPDGITWTQRTGVAGNYNSVAFGNGLFVATSGTSSDIMTSPDGITWTARTSPVNNLWRGVTFGNGQFVAVSVSGTDNRVITSPDGITWTARTSAADNSWYSVVYGSGLFVAVAISGDGNQVMTSPDGITWTSRSTPANNEWYDVTFAEGRFVAVANTGSANRVMTSTDGINWSTESTNDNQWRGVTYANGRFVAVGQSGTGNRVMTRDP